MKRWLRQVIKSNKGWFSEAEHNIPRIKPTSLPAKTMFAGDAAAVPS